MLSSIIAILLLGFFGGQLARRLKLPALVGMVLVGIVLGPQVGDRLSPAMLALADDLRTIAVMVILMKAGLGLDREKLKQQGSVALRLGFLPASLEAIAVALMAMVLFQFDFGTGLLLGCIIGAESPAVIVPGMLRLKSLGWGVKKGIPDAILTGSALSDVLLLLVFSLLLAFLTQGRAEAFTVGNISLSALQLLPLQIVLQIGLGIVCGGAMAKILVSLLARQNWTQTAVQDGLVAASLALFLVVSSTRLPVFSGYLAVMTTGFFLIELDAPLARRLRSGFDGLWTIAEIFLFVLLGASIQLSVLESSFWPGLLLLMVGTLLGRGLGWYLSTLGSNWNTREKLFLLPGNSAKATVQAALGAVPLVQGIAGGEIILAMAALSILVTAPLGAWAIPTFAPKLLQKGAVDPTKVSVNESLTILAAVDTSAIAKQVLTKVAELARRNDARIVVLHVIQLADPPGVENLREQTKQILADIRHQFIVTEGVVPEQILRIAQEQGAGEIILGKRGHSVLDDLLLGSVSQYLLATSVLPVMVVESEDRVSLSRPH
ncbi:cation:proton antiporter [Synechocystis sp. PCC 7339]|uniref:cation:proton antiporter n=1 Tax=unclassified Synechocystis TaxID=2640012 RepID=UPI001BAEEA68|nr:MULTISPECIES: cation:proton antiporter [unclassified Synechocystis]QUS60450.1 cation:proton antiporter [Synechocystis sp. PCC 7338]UAJ72109.1 cation:proton antiporter [Synechocystis sp. PCC 7339]